MTHSECVIGNPARDEKPNQRQPNMTIELSDAIKSQPEIENHPGYKKWIEDDDEDALDKALIEWGFSPRNEDGTISID